jgi:hypothetical protein
MWLSVRRTSPSEVPGLWLQYKRMRCGSSD